MTRDLAWTRLRVRELEGRIHARQQLAGQAPDRAWHLDHVETYEAEMRQLQAQIQNQEQSPRKPSGSEQEIVV